MKNSGETIDQDGALESIPEPDEPCAQDLTAACIAVESERRLWVRTLTALVKERKAESDPSPRVQLAMDGFFIAACERGVRILGSDVPADTSTTR